MNSNSTNELKEKGYILKNNILYCPIQDNEYLGIFKNKDKYTYIYSVINEDQVNNMIEYTHKKSITEHDKNRNNNIIEVITQYSETLSDKAIQESLININKDLRESNFEFHSSFSNMQKVLNNPQTVTKRTIIQIFKSTAERKNKIPIREARRVLCVFLEKNGFLIQENTHKPLRLDEKVNVYKEITIDEIREWCNDNIQNNLIDNKDIEHALEFSSKSLKPENNLILFNNCLYDMDKMSVVKLNRPVFTFKIIDYDYNPNAKSTIFKKFLNDTFKRDDEEETKIIIQGLFEIVGYLLAPANPEQIFVILVGLGGTGKTTLGNIIAEIVGGSEKISDLKLQSTDYTHATSVLINKLLNLIRDSSAQKVFDVALIKQLSGDEDIYVNPKGLPPYSLNKKLVPLSILVCNNIPIFENMDDPLKERFIIFEFINKFRNTEEQVKSLDEIILQNKEEIEWFIYQSLKAYKTLKEEGNELIMRKPLHEIEELLFKHQTPVEYILSKLVHYEYDNEYKILMSPKMLSTAIVNYAAANNLEISQFQNRKHDIKRKILMWSIREELDLDEDYKTVTRDGKRYYPHLVGNSEFYHYLNLDLDE